MSPVIQYARDLIPVSLWFVGMYRAFFMLHRPPTRARRVVLLILMGAVSLGNMFVILPALKTWLSGGQFLAIHFACVISFALVSGNLRRSLITAIYYYVGILLIDIISHNVTFMFGGLEQIFPNMHVVTLSWLRLTVDSVVELLWTLFYCRVSQKYPVKLPLREWLITVLPMVISFFAMFYIQEVITTFMKNGTSIIGIGLGMFIFLFLLDCCLFYWHISMLATRQAAETLEKLRNEAPAEQTPPDTDTPVWTPQAGFTDAFAVKYKLSRREKQALELLLEGKSDKVIAQEMGVSIGSVGVYLRRLYDKTGSTGRFDLLTLIHTGKTLGNS